MPQILLSWPEMTGILLGSVSILLSIVAIIIAILFHTRSKEKIFEALKIKFGDVIERNKEVVIKIDSHVEELKKVAASQFVRPQLSDYLSNQWEFVQKTFKNRYEKHNICRNIVNGV